MAAVRAWMYLFSFERKERHSWTRKIQYYRNRDRNRKGYLFDHVNIVSHVFFLAIERCPPPRPSLSIRLQIMEHATYPHMPVLLIRLLRTSLHRVRAQRYCICKCGIELFVLIFVLLHIITVCRQAYYYSPAYTWVSMYIYIFYRCRFSQSLTYNLHPYILFYY